MSGSNSILWPAIDGTASARRATNASAILSALIAAIVLVFALASLGLEVEGFPDRRWAMPIAGLWLGIALGLRSMSRVAAIAALLLLILMATYINLATWLFIVPAMILIGGVRAVFGYHRLTAPMQGSL